MIKPTAILALLLLMTSFNITAQDSDCERFKNGRYTIPKDAVSKELVIVREGNLQTENFKGEDNSLEFIVNWIDDCTYTLTPTEKTFLYYTDLPKDAVLTVKIIETKEKSYIMTSSFNFSEKELTMEAVQIE